MKFLALSRNYILVSALGLLIDLSVSYLLNYVVGLSISVSITIGYLIGLVSIFPLMQSFVFRSERRRPVSRIALFLTAGVLGALITYSVGYISGDVAGVPLIYAKSFATTSSFLSMFLMRYLLFTRF